MSFEELRAKLEEVGIQASAPRIAVADYVFRTTSHPTAEEVKLEVEKRMPSVSLATVYNTLNLFVEKGLIQGVKDPVGEKLRYDCNTRPHFHFYDEDSGELSDLDPRLLRVSPDFSSLGESFEVSGIEVTLRGRRRSSVKPTKS